MKITVEIPEMHAPLLARWASIGRTIDSTVELLDKLRDTLSDDDTRTIDQCENALEEWHDLKQPIDAMHHAVRGALWQLEAASETTR